MELATYIALSRLVAQGREMDVTAMNLANASTPGFKAERVLFSDWLDRQAGSKTPPGGRTLTFTQDRATYRDHEQGALQHTGNPFDLAIGGNGWFTVQTPRGPRLTRAGRFSPSADGTVRDLDGDALLDTNGQPIKLAPTDVGIHVAGDGTISSVNGQIAKIGIVAPNDPNRMTAEGGLLYRADVNTSPVAAPRITQGALEESNVEPILETTKMMNELRQFQFVTQFVQAESDRQQNAIDKITQQQS
ncbi:MAG TPA: flagellar hook-basal body complex protein [Acetobacteraceae bacterium]|nr:flagellar hook-basal body complex protein [Acetobacteraceae bacterium]